NKQANPSMPPRQVIVYTRPGCHLCDDACEVLQRYGLEPELINIDTDAQLVAAYGYSIPVVVFDGKERFRGHIDERLLERLLIAGDSH
ncbi:MAG TPA: glutaredoxin family protein, partial [Pirellulaceae bacterium]|nr:glutaredoxin family protein [Pirellulaceae bacterium]